ncbi:MAG: A/G-specific adenine glycosylase [Alphaproteobacteria bacterium]|nr:A/G-specific adenine glycosylase [Alphaproteobacteria bacterium]
MLWFGLDGPRASKIQLLLSHVVAARTTSERRRRAAAGLRPAASARRLLAWYDRVGRDLPWRVKRGRADPYRVWLSEIMLQQTTVATVIPYFERFTQRWPNVEALAAADIDAVLTAWQGMGYYSRARNLHRTAQIVAEALDGAFPTTEDGLRALPGIGAYTAAAVAAIAFDRRAVVVDGNVERVMSRLFAITTPLPKAKPELRAAAAALTPKTRCGDYAQAVMDLGATVCTPTRPACERCPWRRACRAHASGIAAGLPRRIAKTVGAMRYGVAFVLTRADGAVLLRRRPPRGLLGGMMEVPSTPWRATAPNRGAIAAAAPAALDWRALPGVVSHGFTHFPLEIAVVAGAIDRDPAARIDGVWCRPDRFADCALPTLFKKVLRHAAAHGALSPQTISVRKR